jgi:polyhydroxybutyrate depolymerase
MITVALYGAIADIMKTRILHFVVLFPLLMSLAACQNAAPGGKTASRKSIPKIDQVAPVPAGLTSHLIYHEGRERYYLLFKPANLAAEQPAPVVMAFHGGGGIPESMVDMSGFNSLAEHYGFYVVYPSGSGSTPRRLFWNILLSETYATVNDVDDLGFVSRVLDDVAAQIAIDTNRLFAAGFSQGGMLCYRMACDASWSQRLAAIATVGATMTVSPSSCQASRPVPVISFHGKQDEFSRYSGGIAKKAPRNDQVARPGVAESIRYWVGKGGLVNQPSASGARGTAQMEQFGPDDSGFEVVSWVMEDGGHTWPGSHANLPEWMMGKVNRDIDASVLIWDFFSRHPLN